MDASIDAEKKDYTLKDGRFLADSAGGLANAIYLRIMTPLGSYWADPEMGSRLHELQREKDLTRVSLLAKQFVEQALSPILDDGRADSIIVSTEQLHNGRLVILILVVKNDDEIFFTHVVKVF